MAETKTESKPMIGIIVDRGLKKALADEAWRQRKSQSALAREILIAGLKRRGAQIDEPETAGVGA